MRSLTILLAAGLSISCAASLEGSGDGVPDASVDAPIVTDAAPFPDSGPRADGMVRFDAPFVHGFNEPCSDRNQCSTGICILGASGGYCSMLCTAGGCPEGFGCYGVLGLLEPGAVSYVCVKDTGLLCSPCQTGLECSPTGSNLCLEAPTGGSFCSRDCAMQACPSGYTCADVGGADAGVKKQCLPTSGACDCQASTPDAGPDAGPGTKSCTLETPFGDCTGKLVCNGAGGWSACQPPSPTDVPDDHYADENCDGIDGDYDDGVFVATAANGGEDASDCGLVHLNPCATVSNGARRAKLVGRHNVYIQAGNYSETVIMRDGVNLIGGYDGSWVRAARSTVGHEARITGKLYDVDSQFVTIVAHNIVTPTRITDLYVIGGAAVGSSQKAGRSSYGIHVAGSNLTVDRVTVNAAKGADGAPGAVGMGAPLLYATPEMSGIKGTDGQSDLQTCSTSTLAGGKAGANECLSYTTGDPVPGKGGSGGSMDKECTIGLCAGGACNAQPGKPGEAAGAWEKDVYGYGGAGGKGDNDCGPAGDGGDGLLGNGDGGNGGVAGGRLVERYWYAWPGQDGLLGQHGGGGGGGGGAGGCDEKIPDSRGAGGGGAGAGGCAARGGGPGGEGGGGSFGIFVVDDSDVTLRSITIEQASGGLGGDGGTGGQGQSGGAGLPGGARGDDESSPGGKGGNGAHGGHGGGGGGGAGGVSFGLYTSQSTVDKDDTVIINSGAVRGGDGGDGGTSAPDAPLPERDGKPGKVGTAGTAGQSHDCPNPSQC